MTFPIEVCLSPLLLTNFSLSGKTVVVVDIFRATSVITTALGEGVKAIYPVQTVEEAQALHRQDPATMLGGERNSERIERFHLDNSPLSYRDLAGKRVVLTTTNGTRALAMARAGGAEEVLVGSFLNLGAVAAYLRAGKRRVLVFCAGRKGAVNLEDSLFAGALVDALNESHQPANDAALMCRSLFRHHRDELEETLRTASHGQRLIRKSYGPDIAHAVQIDRYPIVPIYVNGKIVPFTE